MMTSTASIKLSIIIVSYNSIKYVGNCFDSIRQHCHIPHEIILVDNNSQDGSYEFVQDNYPEIIRVKSPDNVGFAAGNNVGVRKASGEYILLLNADTVLRNGILPVIRKIEDEISCGCIGCKTIDEKGIIQPSVGHELTPLRMILSWVGLGNKLRNLAVFQRAVLNEQYYDASHENVDWVSGAFLLTRKKLWQKLNGLDEVFFMYMEDVDYCKRVRKAGYSVNYDSTVEITHFEGHGRAWIGFNVLRMTMRSYIIYIRKHYGGFRGWIVYNFLLVIVLLRWIFYLLNVKLDRADDTNYYIRKMDAYKRLSLLFIKKTLI